METSFSPEVWQEDPVPEQYQFCERCELCAQRARMIWGEGSPNASILVILDNPGLRENQEGVSFVCGTRQALQKAAFNAGLGMQELYVTYILKCRPVRKYDKEGARNTCKKYLRHQIEQTKPAFALCLGNIAVQTFFEDSEAEVKNLRGLWHSIGDLKVLASYHPLAVRRRPNLRKYFYEDWMLLAEAYRTWKESGILPL
ncbi:MAG: uracil-DNA glycosylase [Clostridia bacterium]|nr:uracil-DNA glycosylase [Clostridia bacterium]